MATFAPHFPIAQVVGTEQERSHLSLAIDHRGHVTLLVKPEFVDDLAMTPRFDSRCLQRVAMTGMTVDLSLIDGVDSRLIVWLLSVSQAFVGVAMSVRASRRAATQLRLLRLDRIFAIEE